MNTLRVALYGCGWIASMHAKALARIPGVAVVAVGGPTLAKVQAFVREHAPQAAAFDDYQKMLDTVRPEALYLAIPPYAHAGHAEQAAARGIHLFLEKPIALAPEPARAIAAAIRRAGVVSQVGFHMRHGAAVRRLKQMIADGSAGRPTLFQGSFQCNCLHSPWWRDRARCGGQLFEQVIHVYDLAYHLLGDVTAAWGQIDNLCHQSVEGYTVEDTSVGTLRHVNGAMTSIAGSNCATQMEWNTRFSVICEKVTAHFSDLNHAEFVHVQGDGSRRETVAGDTDLYLAENADFIDAVRRRGRACATADEGLRSLEIVHAVVDSAANGGRPSLLPASVKA
jgi:predicted dehydrogenase